VIYSNLDTQVIASDILEIISALFGGIIRGSEGRIAYERGL
jgi:hypothetical protein